MSLSLPVTPITDSVRVADPGDRQYEVPGPVTASKSVVNGFPHAHTCFASSSWLRHKRTLPSDLHRLLRTAKDELASSQSLSQSGCPTTVHVESQAAAMHPRFNFQAYVRHRHPSTGAGWPALVMLVPSAVLLDCMRPALQTGRASRLDLLKTFERRDFRLAYRRISFSGRCTHATQKSCHALNT